MNKENESKSLMFLKRLFCYLVLIFLSILCLFSFYILVVNATRSHPDIQKGFSFLPGKSFWVNLKNLLEPGKSQLPILSGMFNSLFIASLSAGLCTYISALTAYAIHAYEFKFKSLAYTFILVIMMVPAQVSALGFVNLIDDMKLMNSFIPLILPAMAAPVVIFFMKQYMESALPVALVEASRIDGAHEFRTFNQIVLPILKPAMAVQAIFTFVGSWNNYFIPSLILRDSKRQTLPILIALLRKADFLKFDMGKVYMMIAFAIIPIVIVYFLLSKYIVRGIAIGSVKG